MPSLYITGSRLPRPAADRVVFCDGGVDATYRREFDLELSHWIPNTTPPQFKADTSTEICLRFVESERCDFDLVVNNHVDVDGVLSTFVLLHPELALQHRKCLVQAAEIGDFGGWGDAPAQQLFQSLVCLIAQLRACDTDALEIYLRCYQRVHACLSGATFAECEPGLAALRASLARIESGAIARTLITQRLVHYAVPRALAEPDVAAALHVPAFDTPWSAASLLSPNARARLDQERVQLVSIEAAGGVYYDLWYPGYCWAETVQLWRPPGMQSTGSSNQHSLQHAQLASAVAELAALETADGCWTLAVKLSPFASLPGRSFPVVLAFMKEDQPVASGLSAAIVTEQLARAFA